MKDGRDVGVVDVAVGDAHFCPHLPQRRRHGVHLRADRTARHWFDRPFHDAQTAPGRSRGPSAPLARDYDKPPLAALDLLSSTERASARPQKTTAACPVTETRCSI